jgi:uncharacterized protein (UPF0276 family)
MPAIAGIGLKASHYRALLETLPRLAFLEVHPENYMGAGGPPHRYLEALAGHYPLSFHGVGLSLGGAGPLDREHLRRWRALVDRYDPVFVSEHIAWAAHAGVVHHDLLPLPYTEESLGVVCDHVSAMQDALGRQVMVENPSTYLRFAHSTIPEPEFMLAVARRTGCRLLLDVNNVHVSARNHGFCARAWLAAVPGDLVGEIHLAGHAAVRLGDREVLVDDHGSRVRDAVWSLYRETVARIGARPTLIEWDTDVPALPVLLEEAARAEAAAVEERHALAG